MIVQYAVRLAVLHALNLVAKELANLIMDPPPPPPPVVASVGPVRPSMQQQQFAQQLDGQQQGQQSLYSQQQPQYAPYRQQEQESFGQSQQLHSSQQEFGMPHRQMYSRSSPTAGSFSDPVTPNNLTHQYRF